MPRGDGTGPAGLGPMTGRGAGFCSGFHAPGYMNPGPGLGLRRGLYYGWGRGFGQGYARGYRRFWNRAYPFFRHPVYSWSVPFGYYVAPIDEETALRDEAQAIRDEIKLLEARLAEIEESIKSLDKDDEGRNEESNER